MPRRAGRPTAPTVEPRGTLPRYLPGVTTSQKERNWIGVSLRIVGWVFAGVFVALFSTVSVLFLYFASFPWAWARVVSACAFVLVTIGLFIWTRPRWRALVAFLAMFALIFGWFALIPASNDRHWQPDVARTAEAEFKGDTLTVRNVREFRYRGEHDYDEHWETRTYDLSQLVGLDLMFVYWGPKDIAHTMFSFAFADGQRLVVSVEARKEVGEQYAPLRSLFKQFELIYIIGDERDLIGLRSNYRGEDVYLFPTTLEPSERRALLVDILTRADALGRVPEFYAPIKANCTTTLLGHLNKVRDFKLPLSISVLLNGRMPRLAYERGQLPRDGSYEEVMARYLINGRAKEGGDGPGFSERIREGLGPPLVVRER